MTSFLTNNTYLYTVYTILFLTNKNKKGKPREGSGRDGQEKVPEEMDKRGSIQEGFLTNNLHGARFGPDAISHAVIRSLHLRSNGECYLPL